MVTVILAIVTIIAAAYQWDLRNELKNSEYWKEIPKTAEVLGICLPIVLFLIWSDGTVSFLKIISSILILLFFLCIVTGQNVELKEKPLKDSGQMLPDDIRRKAITFFTLSPFSAILVLVAVGAVLSLLFDITDGAGKKKK